jgi:hypothetical protein
LWYVKKHDGETLAETIRHDKVALQASGGPQHGAAYYLALKAKFRSDEDPLMALQAKDKQQVVSPDFLQAMMLAKRQHPDRSGMQAFFVSTQKVPNQLELVGILKFFVGLKPGCGKQAGIALDCLRFIARHQIQEVFPDELIIVQ